jgi:hypothetical protein
MAIVVTAVGAATAHVPGIDWIVSIDFLLLAAAWVVKLGRMAMTRHCWKCGAEYKLPGSPGRSESCPHCNSDLKVCRNCASYDPRVAEQCRDRRADLVEEKHLANYCEYFEFVRREFVPPAEDTPREAKARDTLKKLLGD